MTVLKKQKSLYNQSSRSEIGKNHLSAKAGPDLLLRTTDNSKGNSTAIHNILRIIAACVWLAVIVILFVNRDKFTVDSVVRYTPSNRFLAAAVIIILFALKSLSIFIYCGILYAASGILFDIPTAIIINIIGTAVMVSIPYFIGRRSGRELTEKIVKKYPKAAFIADFRVGNDFLVTLFVRLIGILPCDIVSLYFGARGTNYPKYLTACVIGMLLPAVTMPVIGTNISNIRSPQFIISVLLNALTMIVSSIIYLIYRNRKKKSKERTSNEKRTDQHSCDA